MSATSLLRHFFQSVLMKKSKLKILLILCSTYIMFHIEVVAWFVRVWALYESSDCNTTRTHAHDRTHARTRSMLKLTFSHFHASKVAADLRVSKHALLFVAMLLYDNNSYIQFTDSTHTQIVGVRGFSPGEKIIFYRWMVVSGEQKLKHN